MRRRLRHARPHVTVALAAALLCSLPRGGAAQPVPPPPQAPGQCGVLLADAERLYATGQFDAAIAAIRTCDLDEIPRASQARAYELLARSWVAEGRYDLASGAVDELLRRNRDFTAGRADSPLFVDLVARARLRLVRSVSKFAEEVREAPATVAVVTAETIARRGYRDIEEVLHDLPGFDISRGNGDLYATVYQRGYRSNATDRTLLLVDGIEQNDLHSNIAYISRQYPLSNIDRIEVVYGPASTMYGPNAFSGVINVITREPEAVIGDRGDHAARLQGAAGAFGTVFGDGTYAGRTRDESVSWSVTGRVFRSDEPDLSSERQWQFDFPTGLDRADYFRALILEGKTLDKFLCARLTPEGEALGEVLTHPQRCAERTAASADVMRTVAAGLTEIRDGNGDGVVDLSPTALAIERARAIDAAMWARQLSARRFSFVDPTKSWFGTAKLKFSDFTLGVQTWRSTEGTAPWYFDWARGEGGTWVPRQTAIFATYDRPLTGNIALSVLVRYKNDQIDDESNLPVMATYGNTYLTVLDLLRDIPAQFARLKVDQVSTQFRTEVTAVYQRSDQWNVIGGADIRDGAAQAGFFAEADGPFLSLQTNPTPDEIKATDVGLFAQGSYSWRRPQPIDALARPSFLKAVLGLRYDGNEVRENERLSLRGTGAQSPELVRVTDFGKFLSPRVALVATFGRRSDILAGVPGELIVKGIYSKASQQPSNFQRFATEPLVRELPSPFLGRERAENVEGSARWDLVDGTRLDLTAYRVEYSDVLHTALRVDPCCTPARVGQFQSIGGFRVRGIEASLARSWNNNSQSAYLNYTYTEAENTSRLRDQFGEELAFAGQSIDRLPIGDIARHKFNAGGAFTAWRRLETSVRLNFVGARPTGPATTSRLNSSDVPAYTAVHAAVAYRPGPTGTRLQLGINNVFNTRYWDPGVRSAEAFGFVGRFPQPGFSAFAQIAWDVNVASGIQ